MRNVYASGLVLLLMAMSVCWAQDRVSRPIIYSGMCDASGGVAIGANWFAVANDEDNPIRVYLRDAGGLPAEIVDLTKFLDLDSKNPETDLEAAARVGDRVYWLSSHGRNRRGKERQNRHRFFATTVKETKQGIDIRPVGKPYKNLLMDLISAPQLRPLNLAAAARKAPKSPGGLNLEGLCATPDNQLLIGCRNPIPNKRALILPLNNPEAVIEGKPAQFGEPILLDLGGLGIRDMICWEGMYFIIAGSYFEGGKFALYQWAGGAAKPQLLPGLEFKGLNPEAILIYPDKGLREFQLLSDDGVCEIDHMPCKELPEKQRQFRAVWIKP